MTGHHRRVPFVHRYPATIAYLIVVAIALILIAATGRS
jgi:hypothetical protein